MINHTKAYTILKISQQSTMNLLVLIGQAVPELGKNLRAIDQGVSFSHQDKLIPVKLSNHDIFKHRPINTNLVKGKTSEYKKDLAKLVLISSFSFFEVYFKDVSKELIEFHGGKEVFLKYSEDKLFARQNSQIKSSNKKNLQEKYESHRKEKYLKNISTIEEQGYIFPYEKFSLFGFYKFAEIVSSDKPDFSAAQIPDLLKYIYGFNVDNEKKGKDSIRTRFDNMRNKRNNVIHKGEDIELNKALEYNNFLKEVSKQIDKHLIEHFFVIQQHERL